MTLIELEKFKKYLAISNSIGEVFLDNIWIRSNNFYVFFGEENQLGKTYAMFSKKYLMTIELSKDKVYQKELDIIADVVDLYREQNNLVVSKYEFWLPHCLVNGNIVEHKLIAESYGISRDLALDYIIHYDNIFSELFDKSTKTYFGLPLLSSYDECLDYPLKDNTKRYLKGLKKLNNILKK